MRHKHSHITGWCELTRNCKKLKKKYLKLHATVWINTTKFLRFYYQKTIFKRVHITHLLHFFIPVGLCKVAAGFKREKTRANVEVTRTLIQQPPYPSLQLANSLRSCNILSEIHKTFLNCYQILIRKSIIRALIAATKSSKVFKN